MASFFVRKGRKDSWRLIEESWSEGKKSQKAVPKEIYPTLGFNLAWKIDQARARASQLNKLKTVEKKSAAGAARRYKFEELVKEAFLDPTLAEEFVEKLLDENFGSEDNLKRLMFHWTAVQKLIQTLKLEPKDFADKKKSIYKYFQTECYSVDYSNRLIRIMNMWGSFISRKQNRHYEILPRPRGIYREAIAEAADPTNGVKPLTAELLSLNADKFKVPGQFEWVYVSFWFGLRPKEVTGQWKLTKDGNVDILNIYQSKLTTVKKEDRWKLIPVLYPEQRRALSMIKLGGLKRPLLKTVVSIFGEGFGLYSGRKGFTDLMLDKGQDLEAISAWLGHRTLDRTWRHYKNRNRVQYKKPAG